MMRVQYLVFIHKSQYSSIKGLSKLSPHPQLLQVISADMTTGLSVCLASPVHQFRE